MMSLRLIRRFFFLFFYDDVPDTSDDKNRMEEFRGLLDSPYIDDLLDFNSAETAAVTYDHYIGAEVAISDTTG